MEAGGIEIGVYLLCVLLIASNAVLLSWLGKTRKWLVWSVGLVVAEVMLCWIIPTGSLMLVLLSAICGVILFTAVTEVGDMLPAHGRAVLITGCDSGFGHDLAKMLDRAGMRVYAGVLDESGPGAQELRKVSSSQLTVLQLDVTDTNQVSAAYQFIKSQIGDAGLWGLVNNAGVLGYTCDAELLPLRILQNTLEVNFIAGALVTKVFLPMIRPAKGRIVSVSSLAGAVPFPGFAAYGASKAAVISYFGALRLELSCWGVKVAIVQPGGFKTNILGNQEGWNNIQNEILSTQAPEVIKAYGEEYICTMQQRLSNMTANACSDFRPVLDDIKHALLSERPKHFYYPGHTAWAFPFLQKVCPSWLFDALFLHMLKYDTFLPAGVTLK
ncbi:estradiol 17-beta-dehydrogenase 2 [Trichomycterus rosablanca]|uniref:estradiol 17-beta-dehydrogenase 2 n=1 Tax=Trichomycterus rosablanca TaxID=2290929 RepID=UPI002F353D28